MPNLTWLYVGGIYAAGVALGRRAGAELPRRIAIFFYAAYSFRRMERSFADIV